MKRLSSGLLALIWACGGETVVPNQVPVVRGPIPDQTMGLGDTVAVELNLVFSDPDGEAPTYSASSSDVSIVRTEVTGSTLRFAAVTRGMASVTVTATDAADASAMDEFEVEIPNRMPVATADIPTQQIPVDGSVAIPLMDHFADPDADDLSFTAVSSNGDVVTAMVLDSLLLVLNGISVGEASVEVTASDPFEASANQGFDVAVEVPSWEDQFNRAELGGEWTDGGGGAGFVTLEDESWVRVHLRDGDWKAQAQPLEFENQWSITTSVRVEDSGEGNGWACASIESRIDDENFREWALNLDAHSALMDLSVRDADGEWLSLTDHDYEFEYLEYYEVGWWIEGDSMHVSVDGTTELSFDPVADGEDWPGDDIPMPTNFNGVNLGVVECGEGDVTHHAGYDWVMVSGK
ncbi:MAG: hypothetical protein J4F34_00475 [Gemmatimonadetes bacterium]|nr:hypothetical protein [Gemmatimonadota bacterium]